MDAETRERIHHTLATAKPTDTVVVAVMDGDGAVTHTTLPQASRLVDLASSLLDQALDLLREDGAEHSDLAEQIEDALSLLPDRFAEPEPPQPAAPPAGAEPA
jgi:hypothetical protein